MGKRYLGLGNMDGLVPVGMYLRTLRQRNKARGRVPAAGPQRAPAQRVVCAEVVHNFGRAVEWIAKLCTGSLAACIDWMRLQARLQMLSWWFNAPRPLGGAHVLHHL